MRVIALIDVQNDFCAEGGTLVTKEAIAAVPNIIAALEKYHNEGTLVFETRDTHYENDYADTLEGQKLPVLHCDYMNWGWCRNSLIKETEGIWHILEKNTFGDVRLANYIVETILDLRENLDEIVIFGFCTDICVISNALILRAAFPNIPIKVIANACAGTTPETHEAALKVMASCQIDIIYE